MAPEISRRCPACGATLPQGALFCPECGQAATESSVEPTENITPVSHEQKPEQVDASTNVGESETATVEAATAPAKEAEASAAVVAPDNVAEPVHRRGEKTRERLHRASEVARGVIEEPARRVEKIRHVSSVVIEEASYDPSLRFVLVALGLFVVFIILLVLSKVMG